MRRAFSTYLTEVRQAAFSRIAVTIWIVVTLLASLTGPFGTYAVWGFGKQLVFWGLISGLSIIVGFLIRYLFVRRQATGIDWFYELGSAGLFVLVHTPIVYGLAAFFAGTVIPLPPYPMFVVTVVMVLVTVILFRHLLGFEKFYVAPPRLANRIEADTRAGIARLSMDDHYVDVFMADGGRARLLMRMKDAIDEMDDVDGFPVHRSHWVARASIVAIEREKSREFLRLACGTRVPVGPTYRKRLEEAGLL